MSQHSKNYILTLVCVLFFASPKVHAAPSTDVPPDQIDSGLHPREGQEKSTETDFSHSIQITPVESEHPFKIKDNDDPPIIATRKLTDEATFVSLGIWMGSVIDNSLNDSITYIRIGESVYRTPQTGYEWTIDLASSGNAGWSTGYKFLEDLGKNYEPYMKVAIGALYSASEGIGTVINWQRYQLRGEIGCEDLFERNRRYRAELGASWSGFGVGVYVGTSLAF